MGSKPTGTDSVMGQPSSAQEILPNGCGDQSTISPADDANLGMLPKSKTSLDGSTFTTNGTGSVETNGANSQSTGGTMTDLTSDTAAVDSISRPDAEASSETESVTPENERDLNGSLEIVLDEAVAIESVKETDVAGDCLKEKGELEGVPLEEDDGWVDIFGSGQLKKKVLSAGKDESRPPKGNMVTLKITGRLEDGTCFQDCTETFILGDGDVILALDMSVALMNQGEVAEMTTVPRFAYGSKGRSPDIPGDARLHFELELVDVQPGPDMDKLTVEERLKFGEQKRERGNDLFGREDYSGAINSYSKAVQFVDRFGGGLTGDTAILQQLVDCKIKCYNNMAASQLKVGAPDAAIRSCEEVLQTQPDNIKALYRLGKAYSSKGQTQKAVNPLKKALKLDPESKLLHRELAWLNKQQKREVESEKSMYKRMMGPMADAANEAKNKKSNNSILKWTLLAGGVGVAALSVGLAYYRFGH